MCVYLCASCERGREELVGGGEEKRSETRLGMGYMEGQAGEGVGETVGKEQEEETMNMS